MLLCPEYLFQKVDLSAPDVGWRTLHTIGDACGTRTNINKTRAAEPWQPRWDGSTSPTDGGTFVERIGCRDEAKRPQKDLGDLRSVVARLRKAEIGRPASKTEHNATSSGARPTGGNNTSTAVASFSNVKSSNVSKNDKNTPPESLTLQLKKAKTAVKVAAARLKSIRTLVEREGRDAVNHAEQSHSKRLLKNLKKLNKQQAAVRHALDKSWTSADWNWDIDQHCDFPIDPRLRAREPTPAILFWLRRGYETPWLQAAAFQPRSAAYESSTPPLGQRSVWRRPQFLAKRGVAQYLGWRASPILRAKKRADLPSIAILGTFLEAALLNFQPCLIEFVG
jgi:hypothetical protein